MHSSIATLCAVSFVATLGLGVSACGDKSDADGKAAPSSKREEKKEKEEKTKKSAEPASQATATAAATTVAATAPDPAPIASDNPNGVGAPAAGANAPSSDGSDVTQYDDQVVQSGTVYVKKGFSIYKSADATTPESGRIGAHTLINLKASHANWLLIEWPSGPATLSLGWIEEPPHGNDLLPTKDGLNPQFKHPQWQMKAKMADGAKDKRDVKRDEHR